MDNRPIGIIDSGIGGLSVFNEIKKVLPNENYIYYADIDHVPYGTKNKEEIKEYMEQAMRFFLSNNVKAVVIACNTATSVAAKSLREKYTLPIVGIEPAVKPAVDHRKGKRVLVVATPITVHEEKLKQLVSKVDEENSVDLLALPKLVEFAEREDFDSIQVKNYLKEELKHYILEDYSEVVLGCTHFPFFKEVLRKVFGEEIEIIDGSKGVADRVKSILEQQNLLGEIPGVEYYYSGRKINKQELKKIDRLLNRL